MKALFFLFFFSQSTLASTLGRDGNGGNEVAQRFTELASKSLAYLKANPKQYPEIDRKAFEKALETKVYVVTYKLCANDSDKVCLNESGYIAKNYHSKDEILVNEQRWKALTLNEKVRIALHEYFGIIGLERDHYKYSAAMILDLDFVEKTRYSCQLALFSTKYPVKALGSSAFIINNGNVSGQANRSPIKHSKNDVVFRVVIGKNYLRGTVEIAKVNRKQNYFVSTKKVKKRLFDNVTFFDSEPIGVKVFTKDKYKLQVSCSHI